MVSSPIEKHSLSLLAIDPESDSILGIMLNGEFHRSEIDVPVEKEINGG